ncbi:MAG: SLC13 family permease [Schleiferiaceae bacterium]|nr:SLC13 family permease [Schleiferiaceae bacterium]
MTNAQKTGAVAGPASFWFFAYACNFQGLSLEGHAVLGVAIWVGIWWVTEVIPIAATALIPLLALPLTQSLSMTATSNAYGHPFVFLFLGGFLLAIAIEKWELHKRLALHIIFLVGSEPKRIILGFMLATAFLSMWISNTAATVMLLPICVAVIKQQGALLSPRFGKALVLSIAYAASIGGMATLIGTPPNLVLAGIIQNSYGVDLSFAQWFFFAGPMCLLLLFIAWRYLVQIAGEAPTITETPNSVREALAALGHWSAEEKKVSIVFLSMAFLWTFRSSILTPFFEHLNDTHIAIGGGLALFLIPAGSSGKLLTWSDTRDLPWGILLLFGGGMALAAGFESSGLALWIGEQLAALDSVPFWLLLLIVVASVNFLTEVTSNLATTAMLLPVLVSLTASLGVHPYILLMAATTAASCAFMLPVATPPNALVFSSGLLRMSEMVRYGFWFNLIAIIIVSVYVFWMVPIVFEVSAAS